jgi:hypothetical protein
MLKGHLPRVIDDQVYWYTQKTEHIHQSSLECGPSFDQFQVNGIHVATFFAL